MTTLIRPILSADIDLASELYCKAFAGEPWNEHWQLEEANRRLTWMSRSPGFMGLLAEGEDATPIGCLMGQRVPYRSRDDFELMEMFVSPENQREGIGQVLLEHLDKVLRQQSITQIYLMTSNNSFLKKFYADRGYELNAKLCRMKKVL